MSSYLAIECRGSINQIETMAGQINPTPFEFAKQLLYRLIDGAEGRTTPPLDVVFRSGAAEVLTYMARNRKQPVDSTVSDALSRYRKISIARKHLGRTDPESLAGVALVMVTPDGKNTNLYCFGEVVSNPASSSNQHPFALQFDRDTHEWLGYIAKSEKTTRTGIVQRAVALDRACNLARRYHPGSILALVGAEQKPLKSWVI